MSFVDRKGCYGEVAQREPLRPKRLKPAEHLPLGYRQVGQGWGEGFGPRAGCED